MLGLQSLCAATQASSPGGLAVSSSFALEMCGRQSLSEMVGGVDLTWQLWDMMQRDTAHQKPTENSPPSEWSRPEGRGVSDEKCASTSLCDALLWTSAGWQATAIPGDTAVPPCRHHPSPECKLELQSRPSALRVNLALRWNCALKQSPQTKPFL